MGKDCQKVDRSEKFIPCSDRTKIKSPTIFESLRTVFAPVYGVVQLLADLVLVLQIRDEIRVGIPIDVQILQRDQFVDQLVRL